MRALLPLAEQMFVNAVLSQKAPFMRKSKFGLGLMALSGLLLFTALLLLTLAGYGWLLTQYTQPAAALISSGMVGGIALITGLSGYLVMNRGKKQAPAAQSDEITRLVSDITEIIEEEWAIPVQENPKTAILLASVAGFVAADYLH